MELLAEEMDLHLFRPLWQWHMLAVHKYIITWCTCRPLHYLAGPAERSSRHGLRWQFPGGGPIGRRRWNGLGWPEGHQQATQWRELAVYLFWGGGFRHHMVYELPLAQSRPLRSLQRLMASAPLRPWAKFVYPLWLPMERDDKVLSGLERRPSWFLGMPY